MSAPIEINSKQISKKTHTMLLKASQAKQQIETYERETDQKKEKKKRNNIQPNQHTSQTNKKQKTKVK